MRATRSADGSIQLHEVPAGAVPVVVDDVASPFGVLPLLIHMRLPDGRIVAVPIRPEDSPVRKSPGDAD